MGHGPVIAAERILVVMPNWLGDGVMATPFLGALRGLYPGARIAALAKPLVAPVLAGLSFVDEVRVWRKAEGGELMRWMKGERFELGILLPNSFRSAWMLWRGGVGQRVGYARDGRSLLLTRRLQPMPKSTNQIRRDHAKALAIAAINPLMLEEGERPDQELVGVEPSPRRWGKHKYIYLNSKTGKSVERCARNVQLFEPWEKGYEPVPTIDYYLEVARLLGAGECDRRMQLGVTEEERGEAEGALALAGIGGEDSVVVMVPGANFGSSKCWMPERFAQVADRLMDRQGVTNAHVILATSPAELPIAEAILGASALCPGGKGIGRLHTTASMNGGKGLSVGGLKQIVKRSKLMVCNDTGPRHFAAAFGVPTVTLFGPTDPVWAETFSAKERIVRVDPPPPCGPCQLKKCPIDHRCMKGITVEMVMAAVEELLRGPEVVEEVVDPRNAEWGMRNAEFNDELGL